MTWPGPIGLSIDYIKKADELFDYLNLNIMYEIRALNLNSKTSVT